MREQIDQQTYQNIQITIIINKQKKGINERNTSRWDPIVPRKLSKIHPIM